MWIDVGEQMDAASQGQERLEDVFLGMMDVEVVEIR